MRIIRADLGCREIPTYHRNETVSFDEESAMSRLTAERLDELYAGTLKMLIEHGFDKLTMDQIADETKSSKATLYRQWGGKVGLVVDALRCAGGNHDDLPDTGSLRGDIESIASEKELDQPEAELITAIMHAMKQSDELAEAVRTEIIGPGRERIQLMIQRAIDRGEVAADSPALPYLDLLFMAPVILQPVIEGAEVDHDFVAGFYENVLLPALGIH
jgi:AcrR family transcriptional regulator